MNHTPSAAWLRHSTEAISRRVALVTLSAAGLAIVSEPFAADAKKKSASKKAKQRCKRQVGQCVAFFTPGCEGDPTCLAQIEECCPVTGNCDPVGFLECLADLANQLRIGVP